MTYCSKYLQNFIYVVQERFEAVSYTKSAAI